MGSGALSAGPPAPPTPHKKMKKRKELDALISRPGDGKKPKKGSGHRLLRTEPPGTDSYTDSEDQFSPVGPSHSRYNKGFYLQCCKICYPLCAFVMLAACVVACVGLAWMQVALKEDLDALKEKFRAMESSQKSSLEEIPSINEDLLTKQKQLDNLVTGDTGLYKLWINITEMNKQIALLTSAVNHLKSNIKSASDLINLPNTVEELQKSVATLGSTLTSVHHDVETMQTAADEQKKKVETLQKDVAKYATKDTVQLSTTSPDIGSRSMSLTQDILYLHNTIDDINATMLQYQRHNDLRLQSVDSTISNISQRVALLESDLQLVSKIEKANVSVSMGDNTTSPENAASSDLAENATRTETPRGTDKVDSPVSKLREKLQLIHALTDKQPTEEKSGETLHDVISRGWFSARTLNIWCFLQSTNTIPASANPFLQSRSNTAHFYRRRTGAA